MESKSPGTSFGPFLEALKSRQSAQGELVRETRKKLLTILSSSGSTPSDELRRQSGLGFEPFATAVRTLEDAGLIEVEHGTEEELVELTEIGMKVSSIDL